MAPDIRAAAGVRGLPAGDGSTASHAGAVQSSAVRLPGASGRRRLPHRGPLLLDTTNAQLPELRALGPTSRPVKLPHLALCEPLRDVVEDVALKTGLAGE